MTIPKALTLNFKIFQKVELIDVCIALSSTMNLSIIKKKIDFYITLSIRKREGIKDLQYEMEKISPTIEGLH